MLESQSFMLDLRSMYICLFDSSISVLAVHHRTFLFLNKKKKINTLHNAQNDFQQMNKLN